MIPPATLTSSVKDYHMETHLCFVRVRGGVRPSRSAPYCHPHLCGRLSYAYHTVRDDPERRTSKAFCLEEVVTGIRVVLLRIGILREVDTEWVQLTA